MVYLQTQKHKTRRVPERGVSPAHHSDERPSLALTLSGEAGVCVVCPAAQEVYGAVRKKANVGFAQPLSLCGIFRVAEAYFGANRRNPCPWADAISALGAE